VSKFRSRGRVHHVDSTVTCPDCGRRFRTGTVVGEVPPGVVHVTFKSKQTSQWAFIRVPAESVVWRGNWTDASQIPDDDWP
jgi:hypothetical protein